MKSKMLRSVVLATLVAAGLSVLLWRSWHSKPAASQAAKAPAPPVAMESDDISPTTLWAHNLRLLKGPDFRVYIRWIRGEMRRTHARVNPSLDDPESFVFDIEKGVIHANIGDIAHYLNTSAVANAPLKNIAIVPAGDQLKIQGTLHHIVPLPIELTGTVSPPAEGLVRFHISKIAVLKLPVKGLLGGFHVKLSDLVHDTKFPGVTLEDNDIIFDTQQLLPPPHIHGRISSLLVQPPDVAVIFGNARNDETMLAQWHNFLRLEGGSLDFGKLTMRQVDLTMIDASQDPWFTLDLVNYQSQLINGYTRITPQAGLDLFMPDIDAQSHGQKQISVEWLKNRNSALPADVPLKMR